MNKQQNAQEKVFSRIDLLQEAGDFREFFDAGLADRLEIE